VSFQAAFLRRARTLALVVLAADDVERQVARCGSVAHAAVVLAGRTERFARERHIQHPSTMAEWASGWLPFSVSRSNGDVRPR